jgi:hypothetical protein
VPKLPCWYSRVPEILSGLQAPGAPPLLDRDAVEKLFGVRRRQAIRLLNAASGYQVGKTFIVGREALIHFVECVDRTGVTREARARKQRVASALNEVANYAEAQRVEVRPAASALNFRPENLSAAVELVAPGRLQISYRSAEDLLARIVELAASATNDFPAFRQLFGGGK